MLLVLLIPKCPGIEVLGKMETGQNRAAIVSFMIRYGNKPSGGLYLHYNYVVALQLGGKARMFLQAVVKGRCEDGQHGAVVPG